MTNPWPRALTHVGVTVTDLDKAVRWYGEILGFHVMPVLQNWLETTRHSDRLLRTSLEPISVADGWYF